jgi:DNA-binding Lrp family transcriptional regulator
MPEGLPSRWKFLTNHAQVLVCIAHDPGVRLREISERVGITERAAHKIVDDLVRDACIKRERNGRRNRYTIQAGAPIPDRLGRIERIADLLEVLSAKPSNN